MEVHGGAQLALLLIRSHKHVTVLSAKLLFSVHVLVFSSRKIQYMDEVMAMQMKVVFCRGTSKCKVI